MDRHIRIIGIIISIVTIAYKLMMLILGYVGRPVAGMVVYFALYLPSIITMISCFSPKERVSKILSLIMIVTLTVIMAVDVILFLIDTVFFGNPLYRTGTHPIVNLFLFIVNLSVLLDIRKQKDLRLDDSLS
ncbi:MAG: hypothetical protein J6X94_06490 [Lachnospiraceae bacterium]|nr:hypothetical protein [Lachnospiraceae bacterium]